jgi:hypothetical protein
VRLTSLVEGVRDMQVRRLPEAVARQCAKLVKLQLLRPGDVAPHTKGIPGADRFCRPGSEYRQTAGGQQS